MFYKILFEKPVEYDRLFEIDDSGGNPIETQVNQYTGLGSVIYSNSQIDLLLNAGVEIEGFQICNECTKTFNIETYLLQLAYKLIEDKNISVEVFDGNGFSEIMDIYTFKDYSEN